MSTIHERVTQLRKQQNLTQKEFAEKLHVSQAYVSSLEKGKRELSANVIKSIMETFGTSVDWLLKGKSTEAQPTHAESPAPAAAPASAPANLQEEQPEGASYQLEVMRSAEEYLSGNKERIMPITVDQDNEPNIVLVPVKAQAGYAAGRVQPEFMQDLPTFTLPDPRFRNGTFRAFEVNGDSMEPTLYGNDIVVCRYIQDCRWLREMELYVIVMKEDVLVKRVRNRIRENQSLQLISDNTFYPPMTIPAFEIQEVWQVHARLTLHLPAPRHHFQNS